MKKPIVSTPVAEGGMGWYMIGEEEISAVTDLLRSPKLLFRYRGSEESHCRMLEREVMTDTGFANALFVNSGTSALTCCLSGLQIGPGDEVIVPGYTYIATAAAVIAVGAVPVIAEIDESLGLSPAAVEAALTPFTRAVVMVHMQGVPGRIDAVRAVCERRGLHLIEDCCQAVGAAYKGKPVGFTAAACAWSMNYHKVITCGEGGMYLTNDGRDYLRGVFQSDPGTPMWDSGLLSGERLPPYARACYRGNEIAAAIAREQYKKLPAMLAYTRGLKASLLAQLKAPKNYTLQHVDDPEGDNGISAAFIVRDAELARRFAQELKEEGLSIGSAYNAGFPDRHIYAYWASLMDQVSPTPAGYPWKDPAYKGRASYSRDMCPRTLDILSRTLRLSLHMAVTRQNIAEFAEAVNAVDARL